MRAALIEGYGQLPAVREVPDPGPSDGSTLVQVRAAGMNPVDMRVASGQFYAGSPPPPYVPGTEAVGLVLSSARHPQGARVYVEARLGAGTFAEKAVVDDAAAVELPQGVDDFTAVCLGVSGLPGWLGLERAGLKAGET